MRLRIHNLASRISALLIIIAVLGARGLFAEEPTPDFRKITILVMDPLAEPLSCACVPGLGQRKYHRLGEFLSAELKRPVKVVFEESLQLGLKRAKGRVDYIIGKRSMVQFDARKAKLPVHAIARLAGPAGKNTVRGVFVVRSDSAIRKLEDLKGKKLRLGPEADAETHAAALEALSKEKIEKEVAIKTSHSMEEGVFAVTDGDADATVITEYLPRLLEGCGKIAKGDIRVIAATAPVPFVEVFAVDTVLKSEEKLLQRALKKTNGEKKLLTVLESKTGFEIIGAKAKIASETVLWTDWRGPRRDGESAFVPESLPEKLTEVWTAKVTGPALAGVVATDQFVVVADKDADLTRDIFRCFDATTGKELWTLEYPSEKKLEYTNAPRATPVIHDGHVYLLGALGQLHCVKLATGKVVWRRDFALDFDAELPNWGWSSPPLVVDGKLIINPGSKAASLASLDAKTGKTLWKTPGHASAYSAFVVGTFSGIRQIVGYDVAGLGGWDPATGKRLWEVIPPGRTDFNVGTPVILGNKLLVATENNETRLYEFDDKGQLKPEPIAHNRDLAPDTCSPVVTGGRVFCSAYGELLCLDLASQLKTVWAELDDFYYDHTNIIAGKNRVLIWNTSGDLLLLPVDSNEYKVLAHLRPFGDRDVESMSHPAILKDRIYLRDSQELKCLTWKSKQ